MAPTRLISSGTSGLVALQIQPTQAVEQMTRSRNDLTIFNESPRVRSLPLINKRHSHIAGHNGGTQNTDPPLTAAPRHVGGLWMGLKLSEKKRSKRFYLLHTYIQ